MDSIVREVLTRATDDAGSREAPMTGYGAAAVENRSWSEACGLRIHLPIPFQSAMKHIPSPRLRGEG